MAGLFKAKKPESDGIEFWHNPERSGWLMKQGEFQQMRNRIVLLRLVQMPWPQVLMDAWDRRVHTDRPAGTRRHHSIV